jgi:STAM-binding protein
MVPEAFAIVVAPTDSSKYVLPKLWSQLYSQHISLIDSQTDLFGRSYGIFKLTDPGGMEVLRGCSETGFHPHKEPEDGNPVYEHCSNVYKNSNLRFEIFDLR